ncbi:DUF6527 family protein [Sphingomonas sp. Leaf21]|uniref:DUF6527 family protein n=1 Tax=Sphingomonas sp. Leaf21 TaxID=2876550 RepID=UPI001E3EEBD2|nr:DUF6527 family protein [Sphingomonas sp. Leaf21]
MRHSVLEHRFVETFPETLERGVLYVSLEFGSAAHSCCCGCGEEVVTPLTPTDWNITYDGETITLHPSVGSWTLPCRSHYVIRRNRVIEAPPWSDAEVAAERRRDRRAKAAHYGLDTASDVAVSATDVEASQTLPAASGRKNRFLGWLLGSKS